MSKKYEPLSLEKELKFSYVSKPERVTKTLQIANFEKQNLSFYDKAYPNPPKDQIVSDSIQNTVITESNFLDNDKKINLRSYKNKNIIDNNIDNKNNNLPLENNYKETNLNKNNNNLEESNYLSLNKDNIIYDRFNFVIIEPKNLIKNYLMKV